jgi:pyruvate,water dikinase
MAADIALIRTFSDLSRVDIPIVGGKNASLGEMFSKLRKAGIRVPDGFATTADAYCLLLDANDLRQRLADTLQQLKDDGSNLATVGRSVRAMILGAEVPEPLREAIAGAFADMSRRSGRKGGSVAVRSSATAEDLPEASFAGQLETFLNVRGERALLAACKKCYASLFTDRAIVYRRNHGFDHMKVALSVGVQEMVRSDKAGSGVMFSIDTETTLAVAV